MILDSSGGPSGRRGLERHLSCEAFDCIIGRARHDYTLSYGQYMGVKGDISENAMRSAPCVT